MTDFSDRPFVAGSLTGIRTFRIDKYGRLMASQIEAVWTPGENVGRCFKEMFAPIGGFFTSQMTKMLIGYPYSSTGGMFPISVDPPKPTKPEPPAETVHRVGSHDCTCGFHAYFDNNRNGYHKQGMVKALVEGYGCVTVGTRGFRAEKARIQALIIPTKRASFTTDLVKANYPDVPVYESRARAFLDFPLTPPLTPDATSDPDFWTREAL